MSAGEYTIDVRISDLKPFERLLAPLRAWAGWVAERMDHGAVLNEFEGDLFAGLTAFIEDTFSPPIPNRERRELSADRLFALLDRKRRARGLSWRNVAAQTGIAPSATSRLKHGRFPDAAGVVALLGWAGIDTSEVTA